MAAGLYVHIPFCARRCAYCDFYAEVADPPLHARIVEAILREAGVRAGGWRGGSFDSVFIGGGTPSHLGEDLLARLLCGLRAELEIAPTAEWTLEANPESATESLLESALRHGVNRLSLGVQSLDDRDLTRLGRLHDAGGAEAAIGRARRVGFRNLNLDLIYGLPLGPAPRSWEGSLTGVLAHGPEHVSCYLLDLEPHVPLALDCARGAVRLPGEGFALSEYETARRILSLAGYEHYEISNWAKPGFRCLHNQNVWEGGIYLGLGPGAHGHHDGLRRANRPDLRGYLEALEHGSEPPHEALPVDAQARFQETLFLGLRLREGITWERVRASLGDAAERGLRERAAPWTRAGWLEDDGTRLRLADKGLFVSNALMAGLLGNA